MAIEMKRRFNEKELPDMNFLKTEVNKIHQSVTIVQTLFLKKHNVKSEGEYKKQCMQKKRLMKHSHIGWNSWESTAKGFEYVYEALAKEHSYVDRFGVSLDWVMGVPPKLRDKVTVGTGLVFESLDEWVAVGQVVPVQPHFGDHMIGSLNSLENTRCALSAGVTTIGNVSQYFSYEYPGLEYERERTGDMTKALLLMSKFADVGAIVHSNLDDGFGAQFHDLANLVGWAMLERYIVEDLCGARMGHCFGNLFSDPMLRIIFIRAMGLINKHDTPGSMIYGNTIDYGLDFARNAGALGSFSLADAIGQLARPSGHAICPIPVSEAARITTVDEIIEAHRVVDFMFEKAPLYHDYVNWEKVDAEAKLLVTCGRIFFERTLNALDGLGIDIQHPGELLALLKCIKPEQLEVEFGVGEREQYAMRGRKPVRPTDIIQTITGIQNKLLSRMDTSADRPPLKGINIIVCSTDVHEFGKEICKSIVTKAGANVFDLGSTVAPEELKEAINETESKIVLISTFNGIALSYAQEALKVFADNNIKAHIFMGGLINENQAGSDVPVDVSKEITALGINCSNQADQLVNDILTKVV